MRRLHLRYQTCCNLLRDANVDLAVPSGSHNESLPRRRLTSSARMIKRMLQRRTKTNGVRFFSSLPRAPLLYYRLLCVAVENNI